MKRTTKTLPALILLFSHAAQAVEPIFAKVEPAARMQLGLSVSGIIQQVQAHDWQTVQPGVLLLTLDPRPFQIRLQAAEARLKRLKLADEEAGREYQRQKELFERMSIARRDLLLAEIDRESARAKLLEAQADVRLRKLELEYSQLKSPCTGVVTKIKAHAGQAVINNLNSEPLIELICTTPWQVSALVDDEQRKALQAGNVYTTAKGMQVKLVGISPWPNAEDPGKRHQARFEVLDDPNQDLQPDKRLEIKL